MTDGPTMSCTMLGASCQMASECCSGACDNQQHVCVTGMCGGPGTPCTANTDCCGLNCSNAACGTTACTQNGSACSGNAQCCSGNCANNLCAAINPGGCTTLGNSCTGNAECCSLNCQNNVCQRASSCGSDGDVCFRNGDCCAGVCNIANGATAGVCASPTTPGVGGCGVDGQACTDGSQCCSRECVPTIYGGFACQVAAGCRVEGDVCRTAQDCCAGRAGDTNACVIDNTTNPPIGRCRNPPGNVCQGTPEGNVCGGAPGSDGSMTARQDCCDCIPPKFNCCKPDLAGVFRCFGGSTGPCPSGYTGVPPCCIATGNQCTFSAECCNGEPCVPDQNGVLRCGSMCVASGGTCTSTGDCCAGLTCNIPPGSLTGTCGGNTPPPPPNDGGVGDGPAPPDGPVCALAGQMCSPSQGCCSPLTCIGLSTGMSCQAGEACSCVIP